MTTEPTPTPDIPPFPELPKGVRMNVDWLEITDEYWIPVNHWAFAALMAFLWGRVYASALISLNDAISFRVDSDALGEIREALNESAMNRDAWQRIAESRMPGE